MAKKYNPWTGFLEETSVKTADGLDAPEKNAGYEMKKEGQYFKVYKNGKLISVSSTEEQARREAARHRANSQDEKSTIDKAIRNCDEEGEQWITMKGSHVKIDGEGNAVAGNEKVKSIINKGKSAKSNAQGNSSSSYTPAKNYSDFKKKTGADAMIENVYDITYDREHENRSFTEEEIDEISQNILDVFEKGKEDPNFGKYVNKIRKEVNSMFRETAGTTLYDYVFEGKKDKNGDRKINYVLRTFNKYYE